MSYNFLHKNVMSMAQCISYCATHLASNVKRVEIYIQVGEDDPSPIALMVERFDYATFSAMAYAFIQHSELVTYRVRLDP